MSYPGARAVEIRLVAGTAAPVTVLVPRGAEPVRAGPATRTPSRRRRQGGARSLVPLQHRRDCSGDSDSNLIPDRLDAVISPAGEATEGVIDLAARVGLESTGISLPIVIPAERLGKPESQPTLVLVGTSHPVAAELAKSGKLVSPSLSAWAGPHPDRPQGVR